MPFLKFSRDKRGYENYYLFDGKGRPRLLFWFRTPPQVKVGRAPFSSDVRKMIEAQNPGVQFDWARIMSTPIPPPDVDYWREKRRAEKAAKRAAREAEAEEVAATESAVEVATEETGSREDVEAVEAAIHEGVQEGAEAAAADASPASEGQPGQAQEHRRRRRRRRRRGGGGGGGQMPPSQPDTPPDAEV